MAAAAKPKPDAPSAVIPPDEVLFGRSAAMLVVRRRVEKVCDTDLPVLVCGDAGTGKEVLARWIHGRSPYRTGQFVKVNCAAIPGSLLESELFGYEKGAFTGAQTWKPGRVEQAEKGTLFLDEIADLDPGLQSKLLHFVQDGSFSRIGGEAEKFVQTRIICATNRDLEKEIESGRFRADLYYRISVLQVRLPRLTDRREDIAGLAQYFRGLYQRQFGKECSPLGLEVLNYYANLSWAGNIRELSNCIARYVLIGQDGLTSDEHAPTRRLHNEIARNPGTIQPLRTVAKEAIREMERKVILEALRVHQWNRRKTAEALKISYRALIYKIREAGLVSRRNGLSECEASAVRGAPSAD